MSAPVASPPDPAARARAVARVARLEVTRILRGRGMLLRLGLLALPGLLCAIGAGVMIYLAKDAFTDPLVLGKQRESAADQLPELALLFRFFVLPIVSFVLCAEVFGNLFRAELAERTLHHLFLSPVRREAAVIGKFLAATLLTAAGLEASWFLAYGATLVPFGSGAALRALFGGDGVAHLAGYTLVLLLAAAAYGALFLGLGLTLRKPLHVGFLFWLWEWLTLFLPQAFKRVSIVHWLDALMPIHVQPASRVAQVADPEPRWLAAAVLVALVVALVAAAAAWARRVELTYGEAE